MFYSADILSIKSHAGLGVVWLAGTLGQKSEARKLQRRDYNSVNLPSACAYLVNPPEPLSLRLSAALMIGVVRVYGWQCNFFYGSLHRSKQYVGDVTSLWGKLEQSWMHEKASKNGNQELDMPVGRAKREAITLDAKDIGNVADTSVSNIWSELDRIKNVMMTPELERARAAATPSIASKSTSVVPGRFTTPLSTPNNNGMFGAIDLDQALIKEFLGGDFETPHSGDTLHSGIFHPGGMHPASLLDVPEGIEAILPAEMKRKRKRPTALFDEQTMLSREEMFQEPSISEHML
jgi:hypothetical protein